VVTFIATAEKNIRRKQLWTKEKAVGTVSVVVLCRVKRETLGGGGNMVLDDLFTEQGGHQIDCSLGGLILNIKDWVDLHDIQ